MSYRIEHRGPRAQVITAVKAATSLPKEGDQTIVQGEIAAVLAAIAALPAKYTGIRVLSFGDIYPDYSQNQRHVSGFVLPLDSVPLPEPTAPPVAVAKPVNKI